MDLASPLTDEAAILSRVIAPQEPTLTPQAAEAIAGFEFAPDDLERMELLLEKNRQGQASEAGLAELEAFSRVGSLLNLLKSKARRSLAANG